MALASGTKTVLLAAVVVSGATGSALVVARGLAGFSRQQGAAPKPLSVLEKDDARRAATFFARDAGHFRILYEGGTQSQIGDRLADVLEQRYARIGRLLNTYPSDTLTVILYPNQEFQDITRSPSWATGGFDGRIRLAVGGAMSPTDLDRVATHELVHAFVAAAATRRIPTWLNEGLATYFESDDRWWADAAIRRADRVVPLDALADGFNGFDQQSAAVAYAESLIAAEILCQKLGQNIGPFLTAVGSGRTIDDALLTFQVQPNAFHAEWGKRVGIR
jgi:hypothetical protein